VVQIPPVRQNDFGDHAPVAIVVSHYDGDILLVRQLARELPGARAIRLRSLWRIDTVQPDAHLLFVTEDDERVAVSDRYDAPDELLGLDGESERQESG
jgi:hypothetical protein